jgi:hypothetical protein
MTISLLLIAITISITTLVSAQDKIFNVGIPSDVHKDLELFLGEREITEIRNFKGKYSRRDVVEVILFYQALKLGGYPYKKLNLIYIDSYKRSLSMLNSGGISVNTTSMWSHDISVADHFTTSSVVEKGMFYAGIYTTENHPIHQIANLEDLKQYSAVSNKH